MDAAGQVAAGNTRCVERSERGKCTQGARELKKQKGKLKKEKQAKDEAADVQQKELQKMRKEQMTAIVKVSDEKDAEYQAQLDDKQKQTAMIHFAHILKRWRHCDHVRVIGTWAVEALDDGDAD